jgi:hypothetical protein
MAPALMLGVGFLSIRKAVSFRIAVSPFLAGGVEPPPQKHLTPFLGKSFIFLVRSNY